MPKETRSAAPRRAATVRCTSSKAISNRITTKSATAKASCMIRLYNCRESCVRVRGSNRVRAQLRLNQEVYVDREATGRKDIQLKEIMHECISVDPDAPAQIGRAHV